MIHDLLTSRIGFNRLYRGLMSTISCVGEGDEFRGRSEVVRGEHKAKGAAK